MRNTPGETKTKARQTIEYVLMAVLWLAALGLGLFAIYNLLEIATTLYVSFGGRDAYEAGVLRYVTTFFGAVLWLFMSIWTGEHIVKHPGERSTWVRFAWVFGIEFSLILIGTLLASVV